MTAKIRTTDGKEHDIDNSLITYIDNASGLTIYVKETTGGNVVNEIYYPWTSVLYISKIF